MHVRIFVRSLTIALAAALLVTSAGNAQERDPHVVRNRNDFREDKKFLSVPTLGHPIYQCSRNVTITDFVAGATLEIFIDGAPAPNPSVIGQIPEIGVNFDVGAAFTAGQQVRVRQRLGGAVSALSPAVPVTSHLEDYPAGLPKPRLFKHPLHQCGHAVLVEDVVPGSKVEVLAQNPAGGGFGAETVIGQFDASTEWGWNWTGLNPELALGARVSARASLCTSASPRSDVETTIPPPSPLPAGSIQPPIVEQQQIFTIWGAGGPGDPPVHGPILTANDGSTEVGKSAAPGGVPHALGISPSASLGKTYFATQTLCTEGPRGPGTPTVPCAKMPAPIIEPPLPGATVIVVKTHLPGAEILVFANGEEIGHSGGDTINLSRPVKNGETIVVVQRLGSCTGPLVYQIDVACALGTDADACSGDWPAFRHSGLRNGRQTQPSVLADPYAVKTLEVKWNVAAPGGGSFRASPIVFDNKVFIGSSTGRLFAFDAASGNELWRYPPKAEPALTSKYVCNPSSDGIAASVAIARRRDRTLVILGAPDQTGRPSLGETSFGAGLGSGRLFALDANTGALVWATRKEVAQLTGITPGSTSELHEQIGYSAPLVLDGRVYVGIGDHCDNPIQRGRVVAVSLATGAPLSPNPFTFEATSTRGGGIWTYISGGLADGIFTTSGNTRSGNPGGEPAVNHGLSMLRLNPSTGALEGKIQPVPFALDNDPDWSAGATLIPASCGNLGVSTMKDGWTYAANLGGPLKFRWQFPNTAFPFPATDPNNHGDIRYHRAGAAWKDVFVSMMGGEDLVARDRPGDFLKGYQFLHALNVCAGRADRVRWIADLTPYTQAVVDTHGWGMGPPTVIDGIFFAGTNRGILVAIADTSVWPAQGSRCTLATLSGTDCVDAGFQLVPVPTVLKSLDLGAGNLVRTEPVIAGNSLYVATESGRLLRIAPKGSK